MREMGPLRGVCNFFSETGTEGGLWAFADDRFRTMNVPIGYCKKCGNPMRGGVPGVLVTPELFEMVKNGKKNPKVPKCTHNACEEFICDVWDREGLHILRAGDKLTIYSKENPSEVVWSGIVEQKWHQPFTEATALGLWINSDQVGVEREMWAKWFLEEYPATLILAEQPKARP